MPQIPLDVDFKTSFFFNEGGGGGGNDVGININVNDATAGQKLNDLDNKINLLAEHLLKLTEVSTKNSTAFGRLTAAQQATSYATSQMAAVMNTLAEKSKKVKSEEEQLRDQTNKLIKEFLSAAGASSLFGTSLTKLATANSAMLVGVGLLGASLYGLGRTVKDLIVEMAKFEKAIANLSVAFGPAKVDSEALGNALLILSTKYRIAATEMANATKEAVMAGFSPLGGALQVTDAASKLAIATNNSLTNSVKALSHVLQAYKLDATEAEKVATKLYKAQIIGSADINIIGERMTALAQLGENLGITFDDMLGMFTLLSDKMGASQAFVEMQLLIRALSSAAEKFIEKGIDLRKEMEDGGGLARGLKVLNEQTGLYLGNLSELGINSRMLPAIFNAMAVSLDKYNEAAKTTTDNTGDLNKAVTTQFNTLSSAYDRLTTSWQNWKIEQAKGGGILTGGTNLLASAIEASTASMRGFSDKTAENVKNIVSPYIAAFEKLKIDINKFSEEYARSLEKVRELRKSDLQDPDDPKTQLLLKEEVALSLLQATLAKVREEQEKLNAEDKKTLDLSEQKKKAEQALMEQIMAVQTIEEYHYLGLSLMAKDDKAGYALLYKYKGDVLDKYEKDLEKALKEEENLAKKHIEEMIDAEQKKADDYRKINEEAEKDVAKFRSEIMEKRVKEDEKDFSALKNSVKVAEKELAEIFGKSFSTLTAKQFDGLVTKIEEVLDASLFLKAELITLALDEGSMEASEQLSTLIILIENAKVKLEEFQTQATKTKAIEEFNKSLEKTDKFLESLEKKKDTVVVGFEPPKKTIDSYSELYSRLGAITEEQTRLAKSLLEGGTATSEMLQAYDAELEKLKVTYNEVSAAAREAFNKEHFEAFFGEFQTNMEIFQSATNSAFSSIKSGYGSAMTQLIKNTVDATKTHEDRWNDWAAAMDSIFDRVLNSFIEMLIDMEMEAQKKQIYKWIYGTGSSSMGGSSILEPAGQIAAGAIGSAAVTETASAAQLAIAGTEATAATALQGSVAATTTSMSFLSSALAVAIPIAIGAAIIGSISSNTQNWGANASNKGIWAWGKNKEGNYFGDYGNWYSDVTEGFVEGVKGIFGYEEGTDYVPRQGLYELHPGEAVLTAEENASRSRSSGVVIQNLSLFEGATLNASAEEMRALVRNVILPELNKLGNRGATVTTRYGHKR